MDHHLKLTLKEVVRKAQAEEILEICWCEITFAFVDTANFLVLEIFF